jgi:hypothetical protein
VGLNSWTDTGNGALAAGSMHQYLPLSVYRLTHRIKVADCVKDPTAKAEGLRSPRPGTGVRQGEAETSLAKVMQVAV